MLSSKSYEVVIIGKDAIAKNKELQQNYLPTSIVMGSTGEENFPLMERCPEKRGGMYVQIKPVRGLKKKFQKH